MLLVTDEFSRVGLVMDECSRVELIGKVVACV